MTKDKRVVFLEKILGLAEKNPKVIGEGRGIFHYSCHAFEESCYVGVELDEKGHAFFTVGGNMHGTDYFEVLKKDEQPKTKQQMAEEVLLRIRKYHSNGDIVKFMEDFHLYWTKSENETKDLLDKVREGIAL